MKTLIALILMGLVVTLSPIATAVTHMGAESPDLHVTLVSDYTNIPNFCNQGGDSFQGKSFFRVTSSGAMSASAFVVPKGWNLIVTDVAWQADPRSNPSPQAGNTLKLMIGLQGPSPSIGGFRSVFSSSITLGTDFSFARPAHNEHLTTGFVVSPGVDICPEAHLYKATGRYNAYITEIILNGYLSPLGRSK